MDYESNRTRSDEEAKTITIMNEIVRSSWAVNTDVIVANVFKMLWSAALPVDKIEEVAKAVYGLKDVDAKASLTRLCRKKALRSWVCSGERFYEVNY